RDAGAATPPGPRDGASRSSEYLLVLLVGGAVALGLGGAVGGIGILLWFRATPAPSRAQNPVVVQAPQAADDVAAPNQLPPRGPVQNPGIANEEPEIKAPP